jgi:integrase/recombinase XerD
MKEKGAPKSRQEALLAELEGIRDVYRHDVRQFIGFVRESKLSLAEGFTRFASWLDDEHDGKRYSPATINRKIAAARSRVRYAFKRSAFADSLQKKHHLEDILKAVRPRKLDPLAVSSRSALDIEEAKRLVGETKDATIRLMVSFLVSTGVRVSEMLGVQLGDLGPGKGELVRVTVRGKGAKERTIHVKKTLVDRIRKYFHGETYLFEHHGRKYNRISVTNRIKLEALRVLGREVTAQQLRHTWAAIQIKRGRDVKAVAALLGHSDADATLKPEEAFLDLEESKRRNGEKMDDDGGRAS